MRFAYADPPYIGQAKRHYGKHEDYAGEVDHGQLVRHLCEDFDGWALSLSMKSLPQIMKVCPDDVKTLAWIKPISPPLGDHYRYTWEPVIIRPLRSPSVDYIPTHLVLSPPQFTFRAKPASHVIGEKPEAFCHWVFDACGVEPADEIHDLFPGSGAVARAWESFATRLQFEAR